MKVSEITNIFSLEAKGSTVPREIIAGITTFTAMSYIIFLQPMIMTGKMFNIDSGMGFGALLTGTCIAAAFGSILMGLLANYPIGLAPGMGENFFFVLTVLPVCASLLGEKVGAQAVWQLGLGVVFVSGVIFALLSAVKIRHFIMDAISPSLKLAIAGGIGIFIALIGLEHGKIIESQAGHYVLTCNLLTPDTAVFISGLLAITVFRILRFRGAVLIGIILAAGVALIFGKIQISGVVGMPDSVAPIFGKLDLLTTFRLFLKLLPLIIILTFMDIFDTLGTLIGVSAQAGLLDKDNRLPNAGKTFTADALATVFGAACGPITVTSYIESGTGVEAGGRSGLTAIITGVCFLLALFFTPLIQTVAMYLPITAPALIIVGAMMLSNITKIEWDDSSEAIPAFLIIIGIPFTYSIANGMIMGIIIYPVVKLFSGKAGKIGIMPYLLALLLIAYLVFVKP